MASRHFRLERLAPGVYAAVAVAGAGAVANAGIVDLGGVTLVFDTFQTPQAARDLWRETVEVTGRPPAWVANSHWHRDHIRGNQEFPEATVLATRTTRELMAERAATTIRELKESDPQVHLSRLERRLSEELDSERRRRLAEQISTARETSLERNRLELRLPDKTFEARHEVKGFDRSCELIELGTGHTESDTILLLRKERIVFAADLVVVGSHPWLAHGDPTAWLAALDRLQELEARVVVPGHGPVAGPAEVEPIRGYIEELLRVAADDRMNPVDVPRPYARWHDAEVFFRNLEALRARRRA